MDREELQKLAERSRQMREAGFALLLASAILGVFLIIPHKAPKKADADPIVVATTTAPDAYDSVQVDAKAAIVYDVATGKTLYAKNADAQLPLASLTKLLTVYAALTELPPSARVTITPDAARLEAPHAFAAGQEFTLTDLARLTLTASLNDGAASIASATAAQGNRTQTEALAAAASSLNLSQTYAVNGSGLDVSSAVSGGYGSAFDLARLAGALVAKAPEIADATTKSTVEGKSIAGTSFTVKNTDPVVKSLPRLLLSKTGFTDLAGGNLAIVFDAGIAHPIAVVVLGSSKDARFTDASALVAATLAHFAGVPSL